MATPSLLASAITNLSASYLRSEGPDQFGVIRNFLAQNLDYEFTS